MAAAKKGTASVSKFIGKPKRRRRGIHSKNKSSKNKGSKNYIKVSRGQNS